MIKKESIRTFLPENLNLKTATLLSSGVVGSLLGGELVAITDASAAVKRPAVAESIATTDPYAGTINKELTVIEAEIHQLAQHKVLNAHEGKVIANGGEYDRVIYARPVKIEGRKGNFYTQVICMLEPGTRLPVSCMVVEGAAHPDFREGESSFSEKVIIRSPHVPNEYFLDSVYRNSQNKIVEDMYLRNNGTNKYKRDSGKLVAVRFDRLAGAFDDLLSEARDIVASAGDGLPGA